MSWIRAAVAGIQADRQRRRDIARNLAQISDLELAAVRVTRGPNGRCYEMPSGMLLTITNEQTPGSSFVHLQYVVPLTTWDAVDFYGWTRP